MSTDISIIIPALDEEGTIVRTISAAVSAFPSAEIIVSDSASRDRTALLAARAGARVVPGGKGKGNAMLAGFKKSRGKALLFFDADIRNVSPRMFRAIAGPVLSGGTEMSIGCYSSPYPQLFTELIYKPLVSLAFPEVAGKITRTPLSGERAFSRKCFSALVRRGLDLDFGVETGINIDFLLGRLGQLAETGIGKIAPVFKGTLGPKEMTRRAGRIANAIFSRARKYGRAETVRKAGLRRIYFENLARLESVL